MVVCSPYKRLDAFFRKTIVREDTDLINRKSITLLKKKPTFAIIPDKNHSFGV